MKRKISRASKKPPTQKTRRWNSEKPLTDDKQELFIRMYVKCLDRTKAYRAAFLCKELTDAEVRSKASDLLENDRVISRKRFLLSRKVKDFSQSTADSIRALIDKFSTANVVDYMRWDEDGNVKFIPSDCVDGQMIDNISISKDSDGEMKRFTFKLVDKAKMIELLARMEKMVTDRVEVAGVLTEAQRIESNKAYLERMEHVDQWKPKKASA